MLTRAYDAIVAAYQTPSIVYENVDYNVNAIDNRVLNCKDANGVVRTLASSGYVAADLFSASDTRSYYFPFAYFLATPSSACFLYPDEDASEPAYEDYSAVSTSLPSGWSVASSAVKFSKAYDESTNELVCSAECKFQNVSGAAKTVYGVRVRGYSIYRTSYSSVSASSGSYFLLCREHFDAPITVEDQGIISLTFTWRVGRAGLVSATSASV